jgi:glycosyl transferase family 1/glycosyl transferase family 7 (putative galactosyltransferase)
MLISYCTTCMGRLWQLRCTLDEHLRIFRGRSDVEFVLLDYNSPDGLEAWIRDNPLARRAIDEGLLVYAKERTASRLNISKAKNLAHRLAKGDVLVNLDGDNWAAGIDTPLRHAVAATPKLVFHAYNGCNDGSFGRIALERDSFYRLGGYDESFEPMGYQDEDLLQRAKRVGLTIEAFKCGRHPVQNSETQKTAWTGSSTRWVQMWVHNRQRSLQNLHKRQYSANPNGWGVASVSINFGEIVALPPIFPEQQRLAEPDDAASPRNSDPALIKVEPAHLAQSRREECFIIHAGPDYSPLVASLVDGLHALGCESYSDQPWCCGPNIYGNTPGLKSADAATCRHMNSRRLNLLKSAAGVVVVRCVSDFTPNPRRNAKAIYIDTARNRIHVRNPNKEWINYQMPLCLPPGMPLVPAGGNRPALFAAFSTRNTAECEFHQDLTKLGNDVAMQQKDDPPWILARTNAAVIFSGEPHSEILFWKTLASGACPIVQRKLWTDLTLSPAPRDGVEYIGFDTAQELLDLLKSYKQRARELPRIAHAAQRWAATTQTTRHRAQLFLKWIGLD